MKKCIGQYKSLLPLALLLLIGVILLLPLLHSGMFVTDDGNWMIIRFAAFYHALRGGQFPVRFLPQLNFGYGYPVATFLYPGFMYLGVPIKAIGLQFATTIKVLFGVGIIGEIVLTYCWIRRRFSPAAAFTAVIASSFMPYFLYDIYTRGSLGEVLAIAALPGVLWMIERKSFFWTGAGIAILLTLHNTLALLYLPLILIYGLVVNKGNIKNFISVFILGMLMASFFTIPAVSELSFTRFSRTTVSNPLQYFAGLTLIGWPVLLVFLVALIRSLFEKKTEEKKLIMLFLVVTVLSMFMASPLSRFVWLVVPARFVQFPFRFLSYLPVVSAFLTAYTVGLIKNKKGAVVLAILVGVVVLTYSPNAERLVYQNQPDGYYATNESTTTVQDEYMPRWVNNQPVSHPTAPAVFIKGSGSIDNISPIGDGITFRETSKGRAILQINTIYWPGWQVKIDGRSQPVLYNNPKGVMTFPVDGGTHNISMHFGETLTRLFADIVSVLSFLLLLVFSLKNNMLGGNT